MNPVPHPRNIIDRRSLQAKLEALTATAAGTPARKDVSAVLKDALTSGRAAVQMSDRRH